MESPSSLPARSAASSLLPCSSRLLLTKRTLRTLVFLLARPLSLCSSPQSKLSVLVAQVLQDLLAFNPSFDGRSAPPLISDPHPCHHEGRVLPLMRGDPYETPNLCLDGCVKHGAPPLVPGARPRERGDHAALPRQYGPCPSSGPSGGQAVPPPVPGLHSQNACVLVTPSSGPSPPKRVVEYSFPFYSTLLKLLPFPSFHRHYVCRRCLCI